MSRRTTVRSALLVAVAALALSACSASESSTASASDAIPAELQFTSTTLDGEPFDGASLYGEATILWFWAPWCPSCAADSQGGPRRHPRAA